MLRVSAILVLLLGLTVAASLTKKEGYGGSSASYSAPSSYSTSGSSYEPAPAPVSYSSGSESGYGNNAAASYSSGSSNTYSSGASSTYSGNAYNSGSGSSSAGTYSSSGTGDSGNLYYYYYPVTNHSSSPSYGAGAPNSYSGAAQSYYPPAPPHYTEPFGGLLSLVSAIDINSLILPALLIGGVSLLLPAILNCDLELGTCVIPLPFSSGTGRNGRQMDDWSLQRATIPQMIDQAYKVYGAVYESDQCMQRVVCELGGMMRNIRGKETFFSVLEQFASPSVKKQLYVLKQGALVSPSLTPSCSKFLCDKLDNKID